jgi:hypothetical protein
MATTVRHKPDELAGFDPISERKEDAMMRAVIYLGVMILGVGGADIARSETPCFFGIEAFTIESKLTGFESGTLTEHVSDCGRKRAEVKDVTIAVAGFTKRTRQRIVYDGNQVITVDLDAGTVSRMTNPMYDKVVERMRGRDGVEFGKEMMQAMGGRELGEAGTYADTACDRWEIASLGSRTCVTTWGGTLHVKTSMAGMESERVATAVRVGDGGTAEVYAYDETKVQQAPDLGAIMKKMKMPPR